MFETITPAPPDAIFGLTEAFKTDTNPNKINLGAGVYKDSQGRTPVLSAVKKAEKRIYSAESSKSYLSIDGSPEYAAATQKLLFGDDHIAVRHRRTVTAQTPGGTGALRVAADFIHRLFPRAVVWISDPTWANHPNIFAAAELTVNTYPYYDAYEHAVDLSSLIARLQTIPAGDVVVLHGCCHNPTGVDLSTDEWRRLANVLNERRLLPLIDFAYQGFGDGLEKDAEGVRIMARTCPELLVASSYSKNFGLYNERVGALTLVGRDTNAAQSALGHIKRCIRTNYSNPPAHGANIVETVLNTPELREEWEAEVKGMRDRINSMRHLFVETLNEKGVKEDFSFMARQRGMFSFSGLNPEQVQRLRDDYAVYIVGSGRINVAAMTEENMDYLCDAVAAVLKG